MTKEETIKGLECCQTQYMRKCKECPYEKFKKTYIAEGTCESNLRADLLKLMKELLKEN